MAPGPVNPLDTPGLILCSYQFAARRAAEVKAVAWDLVVIDEAHRLRNVYKPDNKTARKLAAQKEQRDLEGQRDKKRRALFARQDEIQGKRDGLIDELERQLKQGIIVSTVLACEWEIT